MSIFCKASTILNIIFRNCGKGSDLIVPLPFYYIFIKRIICRRSIKIISYYLQPPYKYMNYNNSIHLDVQIFLIYMSVSRHNLFLPNHLTSSVFFHFIQACFRATQKYHRCKNAKTAVLPEHHASCFSR